MGVTRIERPSTERRHPSPGDSFDANKLVFTTKKPIPVDAEPVGRQLIGDDDILVDAQWTASTPAAASAARCNASRPTRILNYRRLRLRRPASI
jgi:hypothetical protein